MAAGTEPRRRPGGDVAAGSVAAGERADPQALGQGQKFSAVAGAVARRPAAEAGAEAGARKGRTSSRSHSKERIRLASRQLPQLCRQPALRQLEICNGL